MIHRHWLKKNKIITKYSHGETKSGLCKGWIFIETKKKQAKGWAERNTINGQVYFDRKY